MGDLFFDAEPNQSTVCCGATWTIHGGGGKGDRLGSGVAAIEDGRNAEYCGGDKACEDHAGHH